MVNKKIVILCSIIALIVVGLMVGIQVKNFKEIEAVPETKEAEKQNILSTENLVQNEIQEENQVEENTTTVENKNVVSQNTTQNQVQGEEETKPEEESHQGNQRNEEKKERALELVKQEWGEDDTVYYTIDNQSNSIYHISVRSKTTTETLAEYEVDVSDETVVIQ